jgi:glutamyl-tRNA synthetase
MHWQSIAMAQAPVSMLRPALTVEWVPDAAIDRFIERIQPNLQAADELNDWAWRLFSSDDVLDGQSKARITAAGSDFFETLAAALDSADTHDWKPLRARLETATGQRGAGLMKPLRQALTGLEHGPALGDIIDLMPATIRQQRLQRAAVLAATGADRDA